MLETNIKDLTASVKDLNAVMRELSKVLSERLQIIQEDVYSLTPTPAVEVVTVEEVEELADEQTDVVDEDANEEPLVDQPETLTAEDLAAKRAELVKALRQAKSDGQDVRAMLKSHKAAKVSDLSDESVVQLLTELQAA